MPIDITYGMLCYWVDIFIIFLRFAINPLDKTVEQRTRGYFIAGSSTEVKRYERCLKFN